ncbi:MAG: two-component system, chemotaxis family, protein-glutamate methylesterase/glutaminase [Acidimicrobiaceae bacterium]
MRDYGLIVIGASWGGLTALERILSGLPENLDAAIAVAQHRSPDGGSDGLARLLASHSRLPVTDVDDKQPIEPGRVYLAPPDYHLYVEEDGFALSIDEAVLYSRPSIDVLFESAADVWHDRLIGVILTGANEDGALGLARIQRAGGYTVVQNPVEAERPEMPRAALRAVEPDITLALGAIAPLLVKLCGTRAVQRGRADR